MSEKTGLKFIGLSVISSHESSLSKELVLSVAVLMDTPRFFARPTVRLVGFYSQSSLWIVRDVISAKSSKPLVLNYFPLWAAFGSTTCSFGKLFLKPTGHAYVCRTIEVNDEPAPFISEHMLLVNYCTEGLSLSVEVAQITPVSSLLQCNHKRMLNLESTVVFRSMRLPGAIEYWY